MKMQMDLSQSGSAENVEKLETEKEDSKSVNPLWKGLEKFKHKEN